MSDLKTVDSPSAIGIDLSLTRTGIAMVQGDRSVTYSFGRQGKRDEPLLMRLDRLEDLVQSIESAIWATVLEVPKVACIEDVAFGTPGGSTTDRAALFWLTVAMLRRNEIPVVAVNVSKVKIYATGRGNKHEKDEVMLAIVRRYPNIEIQNNDEADATALAAIGARLVGEPIEASLPQTHLRAMDGLALP